MPGIDTPFRPDLPVGQNAWLTRRRCIPRKRALGWREVEMRIHKMKTWPAKRVERFMIEKTAPIVIGPGDEVYLLTITTSRACSSRSKSRPQCMRR